jgi:hypothetical protein
VLARDLIALRRSRSGRRSGQAPVVTEPSQAEPGAAAGED